MAKLGKSFGTFLILLFLLVLRIPEKEKCGVMMGMSSVFQRAAIHYEVIYSVVYLKNCTTAVAKMVHYSVSTKVELL